MQPKLLCSDVVAMEAKTGSNPKNGAVSILYRHFRANWKWARKYASIQRSLNGTVGGVGKPLHSGTKALV